MGRSTTLASFQEAGVEPQACVLCGALYLDATTHQVWHDEIASWADAIEWAVEARLRARFPGPTGGE